MAEEKKKTPTSNRPGAAERRKKGLAATKHLRDRQAEGAPRAVRRSRLGVRITAPDSMFKTCETCGREVWKWQTECPGCQTPIP